MIARHGCDRDPKPALSFLPACAPKVIRARTRISWHEFGFSMLCWRRSHYRPRRVETDAAKVDGNLSLALVPLTSRQRVAG